jgi:hypothetical protein
MMKLCYKQASGVAFKLIPTYMYLSIFHFVAASSIGVITSRETRVCLAIYRHVGGVIYLESTRHRPTFVFAD